ncbi:MAG: hypothetical protein WBW84_13980, partial [Acidobacteriaceae bacterium]
AQPSDQSNTVANAPVTAARAGGPASVSTQQTAPQPSAGASVTVTQPTQSQNPSVRRAGWVREIAQTLSGGPRYQLTIDPQTGASKPVPVSVSNRSLGLAIAMEALSGGLTGLGQHGPDAAGKAAAAGVQQGMALQAQQQARQEQAAQQQYEDQSQALVRKAQAFESNSRAILNTQQSERLGLESLKDAVSQNADLLDSYRDNGAVSQEHVLQDDLMAGLQSGKLNMHSMIAIPDGFTNVPGHGYEQTFSIVSQPSTKALLTQQMVDNLAAAHVPGFPSGMKVPTNGYPVPGVILANANQRATGNRQMLDEASDVSKTLARSSDPATKAMAQQVPDIGKLLDDPQNGLALQSALPKLQKYLHHDGSGDTFYQGLVAMAQPQRPSPTNPKQMINNSTDANAAQVIAGAFGNGDPTRGWQVLKAYHDEITPAPIKSESEAEGILADQASTPRQKVAANTFLRIAAQQKQAEEQRKGAEGGNGTLGVASLTPKEYQAIVDGIGTNTLDASQMLRYGKADQLKILADVKAKYPGFDSTQYQANLGLAKWATSGKGGDQIQALNTLHQHADDFTANMNQLGNLDTAFLNTPINRLKNMTGNPNITATIARMLAVRTEYLNALNNNHALTVEDKADASRLLNENQSPQQWRAVIDQIQHTADLRGAETNARYRATFGKDMPNYRPPQSHGSVIPAGGQPVQVNGKTTGYVMNGRYTAFGVQ